MSCLIPLTEEKGLCPTIHSVPVLTPHSQKYKKFCLLSCLQTFRPAEFPHKA